MRQDFEPIRLKGTAPGGAAVDWSFDPAFHLYVVTRSESMPPEVTRPKRRPLYWRLERDAISLFSLEIDSLSGVLVGVSVPMYAGNLYPLPPRTGPGVQRVEGLPVFDPSRWRSFGKEEFRRTSNKEDFIDQLAAIRIQMDEWDLRIEVTQGEIARIVTAADSLEVEFGLLDELKGITLKNFTGPARDQVKTHLKPSPA